MKAYQKKKLTKLTKFTGNNIQAKGSMWWTGKTIIYVINVIEFIQI